MTSRYRYKLLFCALNVIKKSVASSLPFPWCPFLLRPGHTSHLQASSSAPARSLVHCLRPRRHQAVWLRCRPGRFRRPSSKQPVERFQFSDVKYSRFSQLIQRLLDRVVHLLRAMLCSFVWKQAISQEYSSLHSMHALAWMNAPSLAFSQHQWPN